MVISSTEVPVMSKTRRKKKKELANIHEFKSAGELEIQNWRILAKKNTKELKRQVVFETINGVEVVKCATFPWLVRRITGKNQQQDMVKEFLLSYRSFSTPMEFLERIIERFKLSTDSANRNRGKEDDCRLVQQRICYVLKKWITDFWTDFEEDTGVQEQLLKFIDFTIKPNAPKTALQLNSLIRDMIAGKIVTPTVQFSEEDMKRTPEPSIPRNLDITAFSLLDIEPIEVARQLTLVEYNLYKKIRPYECINQNWNRSDKEKIAPNILSFINRFNEVSNWVATEVLRQDDLKSRQKCVIWLIKMAEKCLELNNLNAVLEIVSGLSQAHIFRLKQTWAGVAGKYVQSLDSMRTLVERSNNHKSLRDYMARVKPPCVPYIGVYLTDLTFIEEGNKDFLSVSGAYLINFDKSRRLARVIQEILLYQQIPYCLQIVPFLLKYLSKLTCYDEGTLYKISLHLEPRTPGQTDDSSKRLTRLSGFFHKSNPALKTKK